MYLWCHHENYFLFLNLIFIRFSSCLHLGLKNVKKTHRKTSIQWDNLKMKKPPTRIYVLSKLAFVFLLENLFNQFREREADVHVNRVRLHLYYQQQQQKHKKEKWTRKKSLKTFLRATSLKRDRKRQEKPPNDKMEKYGRHRKVSLATFLAKRQQPPTSNKLILTIKYWQIKLQIRFFFGIQCLYRLVNKLKWMNGIKRAQKKKITEETFCLERRCWEEEEKITAIWRQMHTLSHNVVQIVLRSLCNRLLYIFLALFLPLVHLY